jgi:hypothetical protein
MYIRKERAMLHDVLEGWIEKFYQAHGRGIRYYRQQVEDVTSECQKVNELLTTLPTYILDDLTALVLSDFVKEISSHHKRDRGFKRITRYDDEMHKFVCTNMHKSVLLPSTKRFNTRIRTSFEQRLIIQTFNSTPNLTKLVFATAAGSDNSSLLASSIHHLRLLVSFQYNYQCTDRVVEQLALHCTELKKIDVSGSRAVTNVSVQHILKLKNLEHADIMDTSITSEFYGLLLSELSRIANIVWSLPVCFVLNSVATENLHTITYVNGPVYDTNILIRKCPNIRILILHSVFYDLSSLTALNGLVDVRIEQGDYEGSNMDVLLTGIGHRLDQLHLRDVHNVHMTDIITLCSSLKVLFLYSCTYVSEDLYSIYKN